jgi:hypothetical protein
VRQGRRRLSIPHQIPAAAALFLALAVLLAVALGALLSGRDGANAAMGLHEGPAAAFDFSLPDISTVAAEASTTVWETSRLVFVDAENWDTPSKRSVDEALALLPPSVRTGLGSPDLGPVYILVNSEGRTLSGRQPYGSSANFFSTNDGRNEVVLYPGQSVRTALHEFGHAYNLRHVPQAAYAQVLLDPEMQSFMAASGWRVLTPPETLIELKDHMKADLIYEGKAVWAQLSRNDPLEDFANSFALYFAAPGELKSLSTARYGWFERRFGD